MNLYLGSLLLPALAGGLGGQQAVFSDIARQMGGLRGVPIGGTTDQFYYPSEGSTIRLEDGSILHAFNRRERPAPGETWHPHFVKTVIAATISKDRGITWSAPAPLLESDAKTPSHPSLARLANGELAITYNKIASETKAHKVFRYSRDEGRTWSPEVVITPIDGYWTSAHDRMIVHSSGRIVHPFHKHDYTRESKRVSYVGWSDDHGRTWKVGSGLLAVDDIQPEYLKTFGRKEGGFWEVSIAERADGSLFMIGRTGAGFLYYSISTNRGESWTKPAPTPLASSMAPARVARIPGSNDLLVLWNSCCVDPRERHLGNRLTLSSTVSTDGGVTWRWKRDIESIVPPEGATFTDVSYPSVYFDEGLAYVMYFARRIPGEVQGEQFVSVLSTSWFYAGRDHARRE